MLKKINIIFNLRDIYGMSDDDHKYSLDISIDLMTVPSLDSFRDLSTHQLEEKEQIMPYLYEKKKENGQWISYHKSDPSTHYPFVPPYTYIKSDVIVYTVNEDGYKEANIVPIQDNAYYKILPFKWGNPFMCHAFFDMITGAEYGNQRKIALEEFYESIKRVPSANKEHYLSIFNKNWRYYLKNMQNNSSNNSKTILYGTRTHAIVIVRENDSIIVINSGDGINNHPTHQTNRKRNGNLYQLYQLVCKFTMMPNINDDSDTFDERWELINYQMSDQNAAQPDKETLYSKFLAFLQYGFPSDFKKETLFGISDSKLKLKLKLFGIFDSNTIRNITWDTQPLFPDLIKKKIEYRLHEREMLIDAGFLYGTPQVSGSCTFHSIFWHYIYLLIINSKSVPNWFSTWNIYNWEFYKNTSTNVFESGTQYSLYRLVGIDKSTEEQVVKDLFIPLMIKAESIKFIDQANPVSIEKSQSWNETWRTNLTFPDWVYNTDEKNHEDKLQRIFYANILKYWINTLTFTNEFIKGLSKIQLWEWFYFFHKCKLLLALSRLSDAMGDDTAITIIYLRMGQLIKKLFPLVDNVDIGKRKYKLYSYFKEYFILGAWKPSDIDHNNCFHDFINNILPLDKYIFLRKPEHNKDTFEDYYVELFKYDLDELNIFENPKIDNDRLKWVYNKYRKALVLFINHENHLFETKNKLFFRGYNISYHIALINHHFSTKYIDDLLKSVMTQQNSTVTIPNKLQIRSNALNFSNYKYGKSTFTANSELMYRDSLHRSEWSESHTDEELEAAKKRKTTSVSFSREKDGNAKERDESVEEKEWNIIRHRWLHTPDSATGPSDTALFVWIMNELTEFRTDFCRVQVAQPESETVPEPQTKTGCTWFVYECIKDKQLPQNWKQFIDHLWNDSTGDLYKDTFPCSNYCKHFQLYCHCFFPELWKQLFISPNQLPVPLGTTYIQQDGYIALQQPDKTILTLTKINNQKMSPLFLNNAWIDQKNILYPELHYIDKHLYYQNDKIVSLKELTKDDDKKSLLLFQWIQEHTDRLKLIVIQKEDHLFHVRSLHPAHREWYIIINIIQNRSLFTINNLMYDIVWDASWCSGFLNTIPVLCLERMHQSFLIFLLLKNELRVKDSSFDTNSDWFLDTEPSIKWIRLDEDRLDIDPSETDERVMFLYIFGVLVQNDAITSRLFSRIWRILLWYVHRPKCPIYYDKITDLLMEQFYGSPMKREMIRVAEDLYSFVPCINHCVTLTGCEPQEIFTTELFDLNMKPFTDMPKKINIKLTLKINLGKYQLLFNTIESYLENIKHIQSKKVWKKETKKLIHALEEYRPVWEETMDRRYPFLWNTLISYDKSEEAKDAMIKLWGSMVCSLLFKRLIEIMEYTSEKDTDIIDPNVKTRLLIRLQIQHWYRNLRQRPLLLCMFEITAQLVMLNSQYQKSEILFEQIMERTRPVEHILMGVGKSSVLVPWLTMRILFETDIRAIALIQPVHLMETCRNIVDRVVMPWMTDQTAIVPVNHTTECGAWWNTAKDTRWIIIGSDSDWKNLYLSVRLHKQDWFPSGELAVIYDEYDSMFAPNRSELNYSESPEMHPICPKQLKQKRKWEQWYAETLCALSRKKEGVKPFDDSNAVHVRHIEKLVKDSQELDKLKWNRHFGWSHQSSKQTIVPYLYVGVPLDDSQFTDVDICLLLTCTTYFINGVREHEVRKLKKKWIFMREIENDNLDSDSLYQMVLNKGILDSENNAEGWKNIDLVEAYLCQEVLPQNMKMVQSQWNISFVDMITKDVSPHMVGFSGTVQVKDANLLEKIVFSRIHEDEASYKIMYSALAANAPVLIKNDIKDIVKYVKRIGIKKNAHYAIIDAGSWFREKSIEKYVDEMIHDDPTLIVIYLDKDDIPWKKTKNDKTRYIKPYPNEKYLYLYDQRHTVGTDIPLPSKIIGVVTVSKNTTFTEVIQGAFRLRSLMKGHEVQMIVYDRSILKDTTELIKKNDETRKKGWEYALARQSIRTRHRLITNHDIPTYHIAIYHPSVFHDSKEWALAEFKDFSYPHHLESRLLSEYTEQDQKFFSMKDSDESNMSAHQGMDQDQNQDEEQEEEEEEEQDQAVTNIRNIQIFSKYEYVSFSKKQYLTEKYPAPIDIRTIFDSLNISLSPGLLLCLHNSNLTDKYYIEKSENPEHLNDNVHYNIKESDVTPEWISSTSRIAQVITNGKFVLWCTWNEWRLIDCPEVYTLKPEELTPGSKRFAAFLLRYLNGQPMSDTSTETIKKWIKKKPKSFTDVMKLWKCKFNNFAAKNEKNDFWSKSSIPGC